MTRGRMGRLPTWPKSKSNQWTVGILICHTHTHTPHMHTWPHSLTQPCHSSLCHKTLCWHQNACCLLLSARLQVRVVGVLHSLNREMLNSNFTRTTPPWCHWGRLSNGLPLQKVKDRNWKKQLHTTWESFTGRATYSTNLASVCSVSSRNELQLTKCNWLYLRVLP